MIRPLEPKDYPELERMLKEEDAENEFEQFKNSQAYTWEEEEIKGFFGFELFLKTPALRGFCVKKKFRNLNNAKYLIKGYFKTVKELGYKKTIINSRKEYINKLIEYVFRIKPLFVKDGLYFYLKEV
jgi:hypothetical protein